MQTAVGTDTQVWVVQRAPQLNSVAPQEWELVAIASTRERALEIAHENDSPYQFNRSLHPEHAGTEAWVGWSRATGRWLCVMAMRVR